MNRLDLAQAFITLADTGSVQKAALALHQTDAAISRKISKLEAHLGAQLIHRERSGAVLTEIGQQYYHECKPALAAFEQAESLVATRQQKPQGKLTVAANLFYVKQFLLPKLKGFRETYPDIDVHIDVAEVLAEFKLNKMDVLFGVGLPGDDDLVRKKVHDWRHILCASPAYLQQHGTPTTPAELLQHDFIAHDTRHHPDMIRLHEQIPVTVKPSLYLNQTDAIIAAGVAGLGLIWVPDAFVEAEIKNGTLVELLAKRNTNVFDVYCYYQYQKNIAPKIRAFVEYFTAV
tara:strand:- start:10552 stop:11418 length:867 start_codon:yes stop_codon:yes gene_type:complete